MGTTTINYGWPLPTVGGDEDTWGNEWDTAVTAIDAQMKTVQDSVPSNDIPSAPVLLVHGLVTHASVFLTQGLAAYSAYRRLEIKLNKVGLGTSSTGAAIQFSTDNGTTWLTTGYGWMLAKLGSSYAFTSNSTSPLPIISESGFAHGTIELTISGGLVVASRLSGGAGGVSTGIWLAAGGNSTTGINAIKIFSQGDSATEGSFDIVGYT